MTRLARLRELAAAATKRDSLEPNRELAYIRMGRARCELSDDPHLPELVLALLACIEAADAMREILADDDPPAVDYDAALARLEQAP